MTLLSDLSEDVQAVVQRGWPQHAKPGNIFTHSWDLPPPWPKLSSNDGDPDFVGEIALALVAMWPQNRLNWSLPWWGVQHQVGGVSCGQLQFLALPLVMADGAEAIGRTLCATWFGSDLGRGWPELDEIVKYRAQLTPYGLDCNFQYKSLTEGFYPIDLSPESLGRLAIDASWPIVLDSRPRQIFGDSIMLAFITANSD